MKTAILAFSLVLACTSAMAKTPPDRMRVIGEWSGRGENVAGTFKACATFASYMDNTYLHLNYRTHYDIPGKLSDQKAESFYFMLDDGTFEGVTLDNQSNVFQLGGKYGDDALSGQWFKNGNVVGKSEWRLSEDSKKISYIRYGLLPSGEFKEIGQVLLEKLPAGESCLK
jgi:hypothetical protein